MNSRTSIPEYGSKYYNNSKAGGWSWCITGSPTKDGLNVLANCVGYACGRFNEIIGKMQFPELCCNAENFIEKAKSLGLSISDIPVLGGIMVWKKGATLSGNDGAGHVEIVERIDGKNNILTSSSAWNGTAFYNVSRNNDNGRWGMNSAYTFRGCIINPVIGDIHYEEPKDNFIKGVNYKTTDYMNLRNGPGTNYSKKYVYQLTADGRKNATSQNLYSYAVYKKGTIYTALDVIKNSYGIWAKTPSGYVCMKDQYGNVYCERI